MWRWVFSRNLTDDICLERILLLFVLGFVWKTWVESFYWLIQQLFNSIQNQTVWEIKFLLIMKIKLTYEIEPWASKYQWFTRFMVYLHIIISFHGLHTIYYTFSFSWICQHSVHLFLLIYYIPLTLFSRNLLLCCWSNVCVSLFHSRSCQSLEPIGRSLGWHICSCSQSFRTGPPSLNMRPR